MILNALEAEQMIADATLAAVQQMVTSKREDAARQGTIAATIARRLARALREAAVTCVTGEVHRVV